jgi:hypothetical protein
MTTTEIEKRIDEVNGTMAIEGMPLDDTCKDRLRSILNGEISYQEAKKQVILSYQRQKAV